MSKYVIYCLTNKVNGKKYVGQTINYKRRMYQHSMAHKECRALSNAIKKYGWHNFTSQIVITTNSHNELDRLEEKLIKEYNTFTPNGYNLTSAARGGGIISEETRVLYRIRSAGKNNGRYGKPVSQETRDKISAANTGRKLSDASRKRISDGHLGIGKIDVSNEDVVKMREQGMSVKEVCKTLGIPRTTYYRRREEGLDANRKKQGIVSCKIDGVKYKSIVIAAKETATALGTCWDRMNNPNFPNWKRL